MPKMFQNLREHASMCALCFMMVTCALSPSINYPNPFRSPNGNGMPQRYVQNAVGQSNESSGTFMQPDPDTLREWIRQYNESAPAFIDRRIAMPTAGSSSSLLGHLQYTPVERNQGWAGNCWVWAGTGVSEIALDVQKGIKDRLSIQYFDSNYNAGTGPHWAGCGGWLTDFASFYSTQGMAIPWSNTNAYYQDSFQSCESGGTSVSASSISTLPSYQITTCAANTIITQGVGQSAAIANIKNILQQNRAVWFAFFLADSSDRDNFKYQFWYNQGESARWSPDFSNGHTYTSSGGGHAVLCVGWDDTDPNNSYWIMVNSWGTTSLRPYGIFHLGMNINYDCKLLGLAGQNDAYSLYWQTLSVSFAAQYSVYLESREDDGASSSKGMINSYLLPTVILKAPGSYSATYSPEGGYWFVRWETSGGISVSNAGSQSTTVTISSSGTLRAIYANPFSPLTVALVSPSNGAVVSSSPVELKVRVTSGGSAVQDATVMFYVDGKVLPASSTSDSNGYASHIYPPPSAKSYSWYVTAEKYQYDPRTSPTWSFTYSPPPVQITITSNPTGSGLVTVDGAAITTPQVFTWVVGSSHTLAANSPISSGTGVQYVWVSWSDSGTQSHTITVASSPTTYTANFKKQYMLTVSVSPTGGGALSVGSGWRDDGTSVSVTATANTGYSFYYWSLDGNNVGSNPSYSVLMNSPHSLAAYFRGTSSISLGLSAGSVALGASVTISGTLTPTQPSPGIPTGTTVTLSYSLDAATWNTFIVTKTGGGGTYSIVWYPPYGKNQIYQIKASWSGDSNYEGSTSSIVSLTVTGDFPRISLLVSGPSSTVAGASVTFDVIVTNPGSAISTTLYFEVTGPGVYSYFDTQRITVAAGGRGRFQFVWQVSSTASSGQYQILVGLIPPKPTAIAQTLVTIQGLVQPQIAVTPATVARGQTITVTGSGFTTSSTAQVCLGIGGGQVLVFSVNVGSDGQFSLPILIGGNIPVGQRDIRTQDISGNWSNTVFITVTA